MMYLEKWFGFLDLGLKVGRVPLISLLSDYFLIVYHMVGLVGFFLILGGFLGLSIKYNRNNPIRKHPISMYNNCSTL